ncbi:uncharacterized protein EI90DRAFT_3017681 [Cantharellus anzutake]|uniref:uncharacterized protein n=1 Tax=Cantharellus anzutake TaxID=1750568 RepID=UPI001908FFD7|nr:uncharacterized protein EI90DRAFT_3017681 [Cantharellus anzutake]KAF8328368.1 hypothetical protein EI90DRAFT_3017681 [Cantharellus anzutake]
MRLTLRQEWRPRALESFLGFLDIKTGVSIVVLFAWWQSCSDQHVPLFGNSPRCIFWGLKMVFQEDAKRTFYFAHAFLADHLLNTIWTLFFAVAWWYWNPHDGKRIANSAAQKEVMESGGPAMTDEERATQAQQIWNKEKGFAAAILITGWLLKIYFASLIYSYAIHLRRGSYRSLPLTNPNPDPYRSQANVREYESNDEEGYPRFGAAPSAHAAGSPRRRPNGLNLSSSGPSRPSAKIVQDLEAPIESVLWDEEGEEGEVEASGRVPVMTDMSGSYGREGGSEPTDSGSDQGDITYTTQTGDSRRQR